MPTETIRIPGSSGDVLAARIERPLGEVRAWALFAHCFTCSKNVKAAVNITRGLCGEGLAVVRFDFTGLGESEGDFADTNFSSNVADLVAVGRYMADELGEPEVLVGHSLGGAATLHAARSLPSVKAVATIGAPADPGHVTRHLSSGLAEIEEKGEARVSIAGREFTIQKQFLDDLEAVRMEEAVRDLGRALLIFHSPVDEIVGVENAARLYDMARHPKSFISLDGADHLLSAPADSGHVARVLAAWASRYVETATDERSGAELKAGDRVVARTPAGGLMTELRARQHGWVADEPRSVGGTDEGPTPYDLLVAALGACTGMTLRLYSERKGWPLGEVRVRLAHRRLHKEDGDASGEGKDVRLDIVDREIQLDGPLDDDQRARLLEIADRCPVHRTLEGGVRIETT